MTDWQELHIICSRTGGMTVRINGKTVAAVKVAYNKDEFKEFYIGGVPQDLRERYVPISFYVAS